MSRIAIPVALLEFDEGSNTLWVHSSEGATVLRVKIAGKFRVTRCDENAFSSHADITVPPRAPFYGRDPHHDVTFCLAKDAKTG